MSTTATALTALRNHLVTEGIVRKGTPPGPLHPMLIEPVEGAPAAGELEGDENDAQLITSIFVGGEIAPRPYEGWHNVLLIDVRYRGAAVGGAQEAMALDKLIRDELAPPPFGARWNWTMDGLQVIESRLWTAIQRLGSDQAQGFDFVTKLFFEIYA